MYFYCLQVLLVRENSSMPLLIPGKLIIFACCYLVVILTEEIILYHHQESSKRNKWKLVIELRNNDFV